MKNLVFGNGLILELRKILSKNFSENYYEEFLKNIYYNAKDTKMDALNFVSNNVEKQLEITLKLNKFYELQKSNNFENSLSIYVKEFFSSTMFEHEMFSNNDKLVHFVIDKDNEISFKLYELVAQFKKFLTKWKKINKMNISASNDEPISEEIMFQDIKYETLIDYADEIDLKECLETISSILDLNIFFSFFDKFFTTNYTKIEYLFYFPIEIYLSLIDFNLSMTNNSIEQEFHFFLKKIETSYPINSDNFPPPLVYRSTNLLKQFALKDLNSIKIPNFVKEELKNIVEKIRIQLKKIFVNNSLYYVNDLLKTISLSIEHFNQISIIKNNKKSIYALHEAITIPDYYESKKDLIEDLQKNNSWISKKYINNLNRIISKINQNDTTIFYGFNPLNDWYILNLIEFKKNKVIFCIYNNEFQNWEKVKSNFKSFEKKDFKLVSELNEWIEREKP